MKSFADTSFFVALLNDRDTHHATAVRLGTEFAGTIVTSQWVLLEFANYFAASKFRSLVSPFVESLLVDPALVCVAADPTTFAEGLALYRDRPDKLWSLTDCCSIVIMERQSIRSALTADHHFEQAGFEILLK